MKVDGGQLVSGCPALEGVAEETIVRYLETNVVACPPGRRVSDTCPHEAVFAAPINK